MRIALTLLLGLTFHTANAQNSTLRPFDEYRVIMWVGDSAYKDKERLPIFWQRMREMGVQAAMVHGDGPIRIE